MCTVSVEQAAFVVLQPRKQSSKRGSSASPKKKPSGSAKKSRAERSPHRHKAHRRKKKPVKSYSYYSEEEAPPPGKHKHKHSNGKAKADVEYSYYYSEEEDVAKVGIKVTPPVPAEEYSYYSEPETGGPKKNGNTLGGGFMDPNEMSTFESDCFTSSDNEAYNDA